ncbi:hypothetical protein ISG33_11135 [Glaciecola sp. MH2013]|uniref:hypothetical protein n=1 Tax=Glaciecola sp. MH2013 TaxID=2785524 RepID=UPI00189F05A8|nr:hypothetical protein [Glaciecola sp. MH2013]MBF7073953.1 hypothetical protein [Glaciecola sp. MH2013]
MNIAELYSNKKVNSRSRLKHSDLDPLLKKDAPKLSIEDVGLLVLLVDTDTNRTIVDKVGKVLSGYEADQKRSIFSELKSHISEISTESLIGCLTTQDYVDGQELFSAIMEADQIDSTDKLILFDEILDAKLPADIKRDYTDKALLVCETVLSDMSSITGEVRLAVSMLKRIDKAYPENSSASEMIVKLYKDNELWRDLYKEEMEHRYKILVKSFGAKVSDAFRNKDYARIVKMLSKHEHELPEVLEKKYRFSLKKIS